MAPTASALPDAQLKELLQWLRPPFLVYQHESRPEDYERITDEDIKCEYLDDVLITHSPESLRHEELTGLVIALLWRAVGDRRTGFVLGSNVVMQLGQRRLSPDVSVLLSSHADRVQEGRVQGPMDLVVEVISKSTRDYDLGKKLPAYREGRIGEIWLIDDQRRQFESHQLHGLDYVKQILATGSYPSHVLAGLTLQVDWLWREALPSLAECAGQ